MMKVYTPKEWLSFFGGSPSLVIDDNGYIYSADGYYKLISDSPIGKIDYAKGHIYDKHYADLFPTPIAYMVNSDGVMKVMEYGKSHFSEPILYIQNDKIYTPSEYHRLFGGNASGYIKRDTPSNDSSSARRSSSNNSASFWDSRLGGIILFFGAVCIFGVWSSFDKLAQKGAAFWIPFILIVTLTLVLRYLKKNGKLGKSAASKHTAPTSKPTFKPASKPTPKQSFKATSAPKATPKQTVKATSAPKATPTPKSKPQDVKIVSCPHCGAKCRVPVGKGRIRVSCPNPSCKKKYELNS